jgi:hypothetical protein
VKLRDSALKTASSEVKQHASVTNPAGAAAKPPDPALEHQGFTGEA